MNYEIFFMTTEGENILMNDPVHNNKSQINKSQVDENDSRITFLKPPNQYKVKWNPQKNITTFELAQCLPLIIKISQTYPIMEHEISFNENYTKHFTITKLN